MAVGYDQRDILLGKIGYDSYNEYLSSYLWKKIKHRFLKRNPQCVGCSGKSECVHHIEYTEDNLKGFSEAGLAPLCNECHRKIEFFNGKKLTHYQAIRRFNKLFGNSEIKICKKKTKRPKGEMDRRKRAAKAEKNQRKLNATRKEQEKLAERNRHLF